MSKVLEPENDDCDNTVEYTRSLIMCVKYLKWRFTLQIFHHTKNILKHNPIK